MKSLTSDEIKNMKVTDLKAALKVRRASLSGKKEELSKRLLDLVNSENSTEPGSQTESEPAVGETTSNDAIGNDSLNADNGVILSVDPEVVGDSEQKKPVDSDESSQSLEGKTDVVENSDVQVEILIHDPVNPSQNLVDNTDRNETLGVNTVSNDDSVEKVESSHVDPPEPSDEAVSSNQGGDVAATEISALLGDNSRDDEDDEQRELREVEERKLREAVKLSMARQAVKKTIASDSTMGTTKTVGNNSLIEKTIKSSSKTTTTSAPETTHNNNHNKSDSDSTHIIHDISAVTNTDIHNDSSKRTSDTSHISLSIPNAINPISNHLRIDNFQRPLKVDVLHRWLEDKIGHPISIENLWLNGIKTHCYVTFDTEEQAISARNIVHNLPWLQGNGNLLFADFTQVSAKDAGASQEALLKPGQWLQKRESPRAVTEPVKPAAGRMIITTLSDDATSAPLTSAGTTTSTPVSASPAQYTTGKRKLLPAEGGGAMLGVLRNAATNAANSAKSPRQSTGGDRGHAVIDGNEETGFTTKRFKSDGPLGGAPSATAAASGGSDRTSGSSKRVRDFEAADTSRRTNRLSQYEASSHDNRVPVHEKERGFEHGPNLDDLFRKTLVKPHLYWLPVTDVEVERRRKMRSS